jgi:hypothetical protein
MMHSAKLVHFVERWRLLEQRRKDLDYDRAQFARELRDEFGSDREFTLWCGTELGLKEPQARELLLLATAAKAVPDLAVWKRVGGSPEIRKVAALPTKREQVAAIETAKATGQKIGSIVKARQQQRDRVEANSGAVVPAVRRPVADAELLARHILRTQNIKDLSPLVRAAIGRYIPAERWLAVKANAA